MDDIYNGFGTIALKTLIFTLKFNIGSKFAYSNPRKNDNRINRKGKMEKDICLDPAFIEQWVSKDMTGRLTGRFKEFTLHTALQPIYSLAHKRAVGYEALLRVQDQDRWVSPAQLFDGCGTPFENISLDRLSRYLHLNNFTAFDDDINWLFLNVSPQTIANAHRYGPFFEDLIRKAGFPAHRIVIEVVEEPISDNNLLVETTQFYKNLGCLVAIDDFGAGHSNFDRIWTLKPDIVKLDRSFLVKADKQEAIRSLLPGIVSLLHQAGSLVLLEGIETRDQALIALESDVDFVQGFFFCRPFTDFSTSSVFDQFDPLIDHYKSYANIETDRFQKKAVRYASIFKGAAANLMSGRPFEKAVAALLSEPLVVRCYQIGTDGVQIGSTLVSMALEKNIDKRFLPLDDAKSADWFRRHYLKRAILHPGQLQVSRPYLSITGAHMCITLSMNFSGPDRDRVLCVDLLA